MDQRTTPWTYNLSFYLYYGLPFFLHLAFFLFWPDMHLMASVLFGLGFSWNLLLLDPKLFEKSLKRKYRFSFIRFCFSQYRFLLSLFQAKDHPLKAIAARFCIPYFWANVMVFALGGENFSFFTFWGSMVLECLYAFRNLFDLLRSKDNTKGSKGSI